MKVLQINSVCGVGSTGRIATDLYRVLEGQGHKCKIAYGRGTAPADIDSVKIGSNIDNYMHVFKTRVSDKHGFGSVSATKKFIEEAKEYDPDIIHLHNIHGYYINIEILFKYLKESNKPVIWTLHDCWAFTGHCAYFDYVGCGKWKSGCNQCPQKRTYPNSYGMDNSKLNYEKKKELFTSVKNMTIVTPSKWLANIVSESFLCKYPIKVINNGIDLDVFKPTESNFRKKYKLEDKFIILGVANIWDKRKGLDDFIKLSSQLDENYKIILVGLNKKQLKYLPQNIIALNRCDNISELVEIYSEVDVFFNPSVEETMGLVTVESIACATPAIVYDSTATPEVIDKSCGFIIEKNNLQEVEKILKSMYNNKVFSDEDCINRAKFYEKKEKFKEYINLYNKAGDQN